MTRKYCYFLKETFVSNGVAHFKIHLIIYSQKMQLYNSMGLCLHLPLLLKWYLDGGRSDCQ